MEKPHTVLFQDLWFLSWIRKFQISMSILCLGWVDVDLNPHEEFIGLHVILNICADTLVAWIWGVLIHINLTLRNCRGQCFDGDSNTSEAKSRMATQIKSEEPRAIFSYCLSTLCKWLLVMWLEIKSPKYALNSTYKITWLLNFLPKWKALFKKLEDLVPESPSFRTLCTTRWTVMVVLCRVLLAIEMYCKTYGTSVWKLSWNLI